MKTYVVIEHFHQEEQGRYVLIFAEAITQPVRVPNPEFDPVLASQPELVPNPSYDPKAAATTEGYDIEPVVPNPLYDPEAVSVAETIDDSQTIYIDHTDVVFADSDPQWEGLSKDDIAAEQRRQVLEALKQRDDAVEKAPKVKSMPGVGDPL